MSAIYKTGTGQCVWVHDEWDCMPGPCPIHRPTDHIMREFPTHWRFDRQIMERICPHGIGHPDPDCRYAQADMTHGCDGCCYENDSMATNQ